MAKQWLQIKKAKMRREKRAWKRGYNRNAVYVNEKGNPVDLTIGARSRAAQVIPDPFLDRFDLPPVHQRSPDELVRLIHQQHPRAVVVGQLMQGEVRNQKEIPFVHKNLIDTELWKRRIYIGGDVAFFIDERINGVRRTIKKSIRYTRLGDHSGLQRALLAEKQGKIAWVSKVVDTIPADQVSD